MQQAVEQRGGERGVAVKGLVPLPERQVAGQQHGAFLVAFGDDLEEQVGLVTAHRQVTDLVDDQQARSHDVAFDEIGEPVLSLGGDEGDDQIGSRDEAGLHPGLRGEIAEADRQMGLADARWAEQHDVLSALDKGQAGQLLDRLLGHAMSEGVIEFLQRLDDREAGQLGQDTAGSGLARRLRILLLLVSE